MSYIDTSYYPGGHIAAAPANNKASELDSGANTFTTWDQFGVRTSQRALTAAEAAAFAARAAGDTLAGNQATLQQRAQAALTANAAFLAVGSPNNAQTVAQVQTLTRECTALIRLLLNQFDSTAGT